MRKVGGNLFSSALSEMERRDLRKPKDIFYLAAPKSVLHFFSPRNFNCNSL